VGLGFARYSNEATYAAVVVEVDVGETIKVVRAVAAVDCGRTINPDGAANQVEGGVVQATSWILKEQVRFDRSRIMTRTFDDYPILRFAEAPRVETIIIDRPDQPSLGIGEAVAGPTAAAVANAVFDAMGVRVRDLPLTRERIMAAINEA
jgi:CO/xanthine dehydrogenase Mo-binding subunit